MTRMKFSQLIDLAIGSPDLGHVDFQALHFLLTCFAERLEIVEEQIDYDKSSTTSIDQNMGWGPKKLSTDYYTTSTEMRMTSPQMAFEAKRPQISEEVKKIQRLASASPRHSSVSKKFRHPAALRSSMSPRLTAGGDEAESPAPPDEQKAEEAPPAEAPAEGEAPVASPAEAAPEAASPEEPQTESEGASSPSPAAATPAPVLDLEPDEPSGGDMGLMGIGPYGDQRVDAMQAGSGLEALTPENMKLGVCMMKDQLELAMEQLTLLTEYLLDQKRDNKKMSVLSRYLRKLRNIMRQNIYFESCFHRDESISWRSTEACEEEGLEEDYLYRRKPVVVPEPIQPDVEPPHIPEICKDDLGLEPCLVYTADQLLDMFLEMRSEFCQLLNKVNTIAATILEQDYHGLMGMAANLQKDQHQLSIEVKSLQYKFGKMELKFSSTLRNIEQIIQDVEELKEKKADTDQVLCWLKQKVNYEDLEKKVDKSELIEFQEEIATKFCEYREMINTNERNIMSIIDNLRETLGVNFLEKLLYALRDKFQHEIDLLNAKLDHYIAMTDDECAAATARVKVVKDLKCLSCDTACVMHKIERGKVPKMPSALEGRMVGPLITYELSRIRKSGIMGFYRKEDVPNSTKDFIKEQEDLVNLEKCKPRHSGGVHTATTRKDFADKVMKKTKKGPCREDEVEWYNKRP